MATSSSSTAKLVESAAYGRMRAECPAEFVPRSVFFAQDKEGKVDIDRANSLWVKEALVYESVTGLHVNDQTKPDAHRLLLAIAKACAGASSSPPPDQAGVETEGGGKADIPVGEGRKKAQQQQLPDEGSEQSKQVIDAVFLVVGFLSRLMSVVSKHNTRDAVDESFKSTLMQDIVTDVAKLENQLPLDRLLDVVDHVAGGAVDKALAGDELKKLRDHLGSSWRYKLGFDRGSFGNVIGTFCWYYSPFFSKKITAVAAPPKDKDGQSKSAAGGGEHGMPAASRTLLDCLHGSLVPAAPVATGAGGGTSSMPTARQLIRSGVRFEACDDGRAVVEFREPRLRLPVLVYDFKLATVARNLLVREYEEQSKPVTRYFQMMNELVEELADVRVLLRAGVVRGGAGAGAGAAHVVHELVKKIDGYATYPSVFMAMDLQIEKVNQFHNKRKKKFLVRYRPGVIWASSVAAVSVVAIVAARKRRG